MLYLDADMGSMCPTPFMKTTPPPVLADADPDKSQVGQFVVADVYKGLDPTIQRGQVKCIRVCEEVRSDLARLPNGEYKNDHPPFQDYFAHPQGPRAIWPAQLHFEGTDPDRLVFIEESDAQVNRCRLRFRGPIGQRLPIEVATRSMRTCPASPKQR